MFPVARARYQTTVWLVGLAYFSLLPRAWGMDLVEVVKKAEKWTVRVTTDRGLGSGVIVDDAGLIITNFHVIDRAKKAQIALPSGKPRKARGFIAVDPKHDLALLKTDRFDAGSAIKFCDDLPPTGEKVAAFGNPQGLPFSTTEGIVSATRTGTQLIEVFGQDVYSHLGYAADATWVQATAPISPGNSGGPLVTMNAELVGLNTWSRTDGQNLNFAISVVDIKRIIESARGLAAQDFSNLPVLRAEPVETPPGSNKPFRLALPTGRTFSFSVFSPDSSGLKASAGDAIVLLKHTNGSVFAAASHQNGLLNGTTVARYENKEPMVYVTYLAGKRHGVLKTWSEAGDPVLFAQYTRGKRDGFSCFFEEGHLRMVSEHKSDELKWVQLMADEATLDGFADRAAAESNATARDIFTKLEKVEAMLKVNEIAFRKQIAEYENATRRSLAAQLGSKKRQTEMRRANQRSAESAAALRELQQRALGK